MKKIFCLISVLWILPFTIDAQDDAWRKDQRQNLFDECMSKSTKWNINEEQKNSLCLCFLNEIEKEYTATQFYNLLTVELDRIEKATIIKCSEKFGLNLDMPAVKETTQSSINVRTGINISNFTRDDLIGIWKDENSKIYLNDDGTFAIKWDANGSTSHGSWYLDRNKSIVLSSLKWPLVIVHFDGNNLKYRQKNDYYTATRRLE